MLNFMHMHAHSCIRIHVHRQNVLLDAHMNGKLGDFGFARELPEMVNGRSIVSVALFVKSAGYSAPELDAYRHSPRTDVYAYGVVRCTFSIYPLTNG